jgi:hypothetical protein
MIYRLLFCPSSEPILISFLLAGPLGRSAQLLRVCRSCHEEASPVLYGESQFALDWAYSGTESIIIDFLEKIGPTNRQFVRHLRVSHYSIWTLEKLRARRTLRPILENLESLWLKFYIQYSLDSNGASSIERSSAKILRDVQTFLKTQRGPYRKLVKAFKAIEDPDQCPVLRVRLVSATAKPDLKVCHLVVCSKLQC